MEPDVTRAAAARPLGTQTENEACALARAEQKDKNKEEEDASRGRSAVNAVRSAGSRTRACHRPAAARTKTAATTNKIVAKAVAKADVAVATAASTGDEAATKTTSTLDVSVTKTAVAANRGRRDCGHGSIHEGRGRDKEHVHGRRQTRLWPDSTVVAARARAMMMAATLAVVEYKFVILSKRRRGR